MPWFLYLQPSAVRGQHTHLNPPQHSAGGRLHTGRLTCFDLCSVLGPWDPANKQRDLSQPLCWHIFPPQYCISPRQHCIKEKHTLTQAHELYTKRHTQTLYRRHILPHPNTICHRQPCTVSVPLPVYLSYSLRLPICLFHEKPSSSSALNWWILPSCGQCSFH